MRDDKGKDCVETIFPKSGPIWLILSGRGIRIYRCYCNLTNSHVLISAENDDGNSKLKSRPFLFMCIFLNTFHAKMHPYFFQTE